MPLPRKDGTGRMVAEWRRFVLSDPAFPIVKYEHHNQDGTKVTKEGPVVVVYLRPLLATEVDKADESRLEFVARHVTGGFFNEVTDEFQKEPSPLMADGSPVALTDSLCIRFFRILAMQEPMVGMPPMPKDGRKVEVIDMAEATVVFDEFWRGLDDSYSRVWVESYQGKGWRRPQTSEPPPIGS